MRWLRSEEGAAVVEYALILLMVVLVVVPILPGLGNAVTPFFTRIAAALTIP